RDDLVTGVQTCALPIYIEEQRRTDREYNMPKALPEGWRDTILLGGEESSGLTTRGHVTDKDGVWANLLVMDMLSYYGSTDAEARSEERRVGKACGGEGR